jgi:hypothetical protein
MTPKNLRRSVRLGRLPSKAPLRPQVAASGRSLHRVVPPNEPRPRTTRRYGKVVRKVLTCWAFGAPIWRFAMTRAKQVSKRKHSMKALPAWGAAGMSLAMVGGASATGVAPAEKGSSQAMLPVITLGEEELSDVSLSKFFVFDRESTASSRLGLQYAQRGCRGCRGCAVGRCGGCRCGGGCAIRRCGGCGLGIGCARCSCSCCLSWGACQFC